MNIIGSNDGLFWESWKKLIGKVDYNHPIYSEIGIEFYKEYFFSSKDVKNQSFIILNGDIPIIGIILSVDRKDSLNRLSGFGRGINYVENNSGEIDGIKSARKIFKKEFDIILKNNGINSIFFRDYCSVNGSISLLGRQLLDLGGIANSHFVQLIDLNKPIESIHSNLSKSCRNSVSWGRKNLELTFLDSKSILEGNVDELRDLHIREAGRETRSKKSWRIMYNMIQTGHAFIIEGKMDGILVTSSLFYISQKVCLYAVSASSRDLFDKPIGHIILWEAINKSKEKGCKYFDSGGLVYNSSKEEVSNKQININRYKKNFGGETKVQLTIDCNLYEK